MELSNNQLLKEEKNILYSKSNNIKQAIYNSIFGNEAIQDPIDGLIFGYFIGFFSELNDKPLEEEKIKELYNTFKEYHLNSSYENLISKSIEYLPKKLLNIPFEIKKENKFFDINANNLNNNNDLKGEEFEHGKCEICLGKFNILDKQNYFLECGCIIHNKCFDNFIINCIEQNIPFSDIICPLCNKIIIPIDFIITSLTNSKRNDLIEKNEILSEKVYPNKKINQPKEEKNENVIHCLNIKCNYNFIPAEKNQIDKFKCPKCNKQYCLKCNDYWHDGLSCNEFQEKLKLINNSINSFKEYAKNNKIVECPICKTWLSEDENSKMCNLCLCICGNKINI